MQPNAIHVSAPGKVVLSGEYAVLDGAPAVCMAVNRRARVTIVATDSDNHTVVAPGHVDDVTRFRTVGDTIEWIDDGAALELFEHIWHASGLRPESGLALTLDTAGFLDAAHGCKTGIGSSAALAVALAYALCELAAHDGDADNVAHRGHLAFQNGLGSGVDVATAIAGGLVEFTMSDRRAKRLRMPEGLECRVLWSGMPAKTGKKLERYSSRGSQPSRAALTYTARRIAEAWGAGEAQRVLREYRDYIRILQEFSVDHDLGIFDAGHDKMVAAAESHGLVYKPCGAGGGDIGIILADDARAVDDFTEGSLTAAFQLMDLSIDAKGVQVVRTELD